MDEPVNAIAWALLPALVLPAALAGAAHAQALGDPTQPANAVVAPEAAVAAAPPQRLQSTLLSGGRRLAVIDGQTVPLGGAIDGAIVASISDTEVVLRRGSETEVLKLHPAVQKTTKKNTSGGRP